MCPVSPVNSRCNLFLLKQTLGLEYSSVVKKKPFELLHLLLTSGFDNRYKLTETYIKAFHLDTAPVNSHSALYPLLLLVFFYTPFSVAFFSILGLVLLQSILCEPLIFCFIAMQ